MKVFNIDYKCGNCGYEWNEEYDKGDVVEEGWDGVFLQSHKCEHHIGCKYCHRIKCPVCDCDGFLSHNAPIIKKRNPILGK